MTICMIFFVLSCATTAEQSQGPAVCADGKSGDSVGSSVDSIEELSFEDQNPQQDEEQPQHTSNLPSLPGAAFRIEISSDEYRVLQRRYSGQLAYVRNPARENDVKDMLSRYNRVNASRAGHVIVSVNPSNGKLMKYRFVRTTYVREFDSLILKDLSSIRFRVKRKGHPSAIYITYVISVSRDQAPRALP